LSESPLGSGQLEVMALDEQAPARDPIGNAAAPNGMIDSRPELAAYGVAVGPLAHCLVDPGAFDVERLILFLADPERPGAGIPPKPPQCKIRHSGSRGIKLRAQREPNVEPYLDESIVESGSALFVGAPFVRVSAKRGRQCRISLAFVGIHSRFKAL
jgi:hypothetical protein